MYAAPIKRPRDVVYDTVKRRIMMNEMNPEVGLTELGLARELGCSQGTVREALLRLQEEGSWPAPAIVAPPSRASTQRRRTRFLALRRRIEIRGAPRAAQNVTEESIERLKDIQADMEAVAQKGDEYGLIELDMVFHLTIFRLSGLEALEQILTRCTLHSHRSKLWAPGHRRPLLETALRHRALIALLASGDGAGLAKAIGEHIDTIVTREGEPS